jgi:hypothetical protein
MDGGLAKKDAHHGHIEQMACDSPIEFRCCIFGWGIAAPQNPSRENTVEECLNQSGMEKMVASIPFKSYVESFFKRSTNWPQSYDIASLNSVQRYARIVGQ